MSDLILVKHAKPLVVAGNPPREWVLSQAGRVQSEELARRLAPYEPSVVYSSEEPKAAQTAEIISSRPHVPFSTRSGLHENDRTGFPLFKDAAVYNARMEVFFRQPAENSVGAETANQAHGRFIRSVENILASELERPAIIVSHGAVISLFVACANDLDPYSFWLEFGFTSFAVLSRASLALKEIVHPVARQS